MGETHDVTLAVLAGGAGSRMGLPKGHLVLKGRPILPYLLDRLSWEGPTLLVTAPGREHPPGWESFSREVSDPVADSGPLRGVLTALTCTTTPLLAIIAVDMPGVSREALNWMVDHLRLRPASAGMMIRQESDVIEPFPCVLRVAEANPLVQRHFDAGRRSVAQLARNGEIDAISPPAEWPLYLWTNLNDPDALAEFLMSRKEST